MATITISSPTLNIVSGEGIQLGPIQITPTIAPVPGSINSLGPGSTVILVPAGAAGIAFFPPSNNSGSLFLKGIAADTGFAIPRSTPSIFFFDTTQTGFNLALTTGAAAGLVNYLIF